MNYLAGITAGVVTAFVLSVLVGFAHDPGRPDTTWTPEPRPAPVVTPIAENMNDHVIIDDPPMRCLLACLRCAQPAVTCVVVP